jgi:prefoldin alpha subunit
MEKSEYLMKLKIIEQEANEREKQLNLFEEHLKDLEEIKKALKELEENNDKEIFANIGKGVYISAELKNKELLVETGNRVLVKKSIPQTIDLIEKQIEKINSEKIKVLGSIEGLHKEMEEIINSSNPSSEENSSCDCGDNCSCENCECENNN